MIANRTAIDGPWVGLLVELFDDDDPDRYHAHRGKICWLDSFANSQNNYKNKGLLRRAGVKRQEGELFLRNVPIDAPYPVQTIDGRAHLATSLPDLEKMKNSRVPGFDKKFDEVRLVWYFYQLQMDVLRIRPLVDG